MSDLCVGRVIAQLDLAERALNDLEMQLRAAWNRDRPSEQGLSASERANLRQAEQFQLGQVDGLVTAQLQLADRRRHYSALHNLRTRAVVVDPGTPAGGAGL